MRMWARSILDVFLIVLSTFIALLLRDDFSTTISRVVDLAPYLGGSALAGLIVLPLTGVSHSIWRFNSAHDHARIFLSVAAIVSLALAIGFAVNRLESVPRSLPIIQLLLAYLILAGTRDLLRGYHLARRSNAAKAAQFGPISSSQPTAIVVIGMSQLVDLYLRLVDMIGGDRIRVAAVLSRNVRHKGRVIRNHRVIGSADEIEDVLRELTVRGVHVERIVVADDFELLSAKSQEMLQKIQSIGQIKVQKLTADLLLGQDTKADAAVMARVDQSVIDASITNQAQMALRFALDDDQIVELSKRRYWLVKRAFDIVLSSLLIIVLAPVFVIGAALVAFDVGRPILFWQQRPGLGGKPLRVVKLRTMKNSVSPNGLKLSDAERTSAIGLFMRQYRLDELPQLFSILFGEMSFVGPRPLLPHDQPLAANARLLVRPGLTGWAQVTGGRSVSADDKMALDVWYLRHASLWLDIKILLRTASILIGGEVYDQKVISEAWRDLTRLRTEQEQKLYAAE